MLRQHEPTAAERTDFLDFYGPTYWGACRAVDMVPDAIIRNRNDFARAWRLKSIARPTIERNTSFSKQGEIDHLEIYRDLDGAYVVLCSNYGDTLPPPQLGMSPVACLYVTGARSYATRFNTLKELKGAFKAVAKATQEASR